MSSELQLDVCCLGCCGGAIWWTHTKERQAWCYLQVKLCDPRLSALSVVATIKALYKYTSFLSFPFFQTLFLTPNQQRQSTESKQIWNTHPIFQTRTQNKVWPPQRKCGVRQCRSHTHLVPYTVHAWAMSQQILCDYVTGPILVCALHKLSFSYLFRHLPTYLQPRDPYEANGH